MTKSSITLLAAALSFVGTATAHGQTAPLKPAAQGVSATCALPDRSRHAINAVVQHEGQQYQCIEVYDENLRPAGVRWARTNPRAAVSAARLSPRSAPILIAPAAPAPRPTRVPIRIYDTPLPKPVPAPDGVGPTTSI